jgi:hypothetical protein
MPSVTSLSQYTFSNLGPLTTTWTAPSSCATQKDIYLAPSSRPDQAWVASTCGYSPRGSCYPGGSSSQYDEIFTINQNMWVGGVVPYYSPGLYCPDQYTTAGIAVKDGDGKLVSSSGLFAPTVSGTSTITTGPQTYTTTWNRYQFNSTSAVTSTVTNTHAPTYNPYWNVFMEALGPSETAVACCPRYSIHPNPSKN